MGCWEPGWLWGAVETIGIDAGAMTELRHGVALGARATLKALDEIFEEDLPRRPELLK